MGYRGNSRQETGTGPEKQEVRHQEEQKAFSHDTVIHPRKYNRRHIQIIKTIALLMRAAVRPSVLFFSVPCSLICLVLKMAVSIFHIVQFMPTVSYIFHL
jgi:hypothetical protein